MKRTREIVSARLPADLIAVVERYREASIAPATARAYRSALGSWGKWCASKGMTAWPPKPRIVEAYCADLAQRGRSFATIGLALAALTDALRREGTEQRGEVFGKQLAEGFRTSIAKVLRGIRRVHGVAPVRRAQPLMARDLEQAVGSLGASSHRGVRAAQWGAAKVCERAYLLLTWSAALRRSEAAALERRDLVATGDSGWLMTLRRSKTDQEGVGEVIAVGCTDGTGTCPAHALAAWLAIRPGAFACRQCGNTGTWKRKPCRRCPCVHCRGAGCERCPLFGVSARTIARSVQRAAKRLGFDASGFSGHSLRAGLITSAHLAGVSTIDIARVSRHKGQTQLAKYIRGADILAGRTPAQRAMAGLVAPHRVTTGDSAGSTDGPAKPEGVKTERTPSAT